MVHASLGAVLHHLHRLGASCDGDDHSDRQLLEGFVRQRDETAFALLLSRHGPMVLGVCRRILRQPQDVEDAFQATFLVLVRQAQTVRRQASLASWLYGVALRTAQRARLDAVRRTLREERAAAPSAVEGSNEPDWRDLRAALDEEIARLPEKYRAPLILCHLEGHTNAQISRRLHVPLGSLSKRLAQARGLLRGQLLRRGVTLSGAALVTVLAGQVSAVPPLLARTTTGTVLLALAGAGGVPPSVAALAAGVARTLAAAPLRIALQSVVAVGLLIGLGLAARPADPNPQSAVTAAPLAGPQQFVRQEEPTARQEEPLLARQEEPPAQVEAPDAQGPRQRLLRLRGGDAKSETAVAAGLLWIAKQQAVDGHWSLDALGGQKNDIAGTALALLPLLGAGHTHKAGDPFARNVDRGLQFLLSKQKQDGDFGGGMYAQALASSVLFRAYALTGDPKLAAPAQAALRYIIKAQHEAGGWRYQPNQPGDLSVSAWFIEALHDARSAGLPVPQRMLMNAAGFVQSCRRGEGYGYIPQGNATPTMSAAGLLCRLRLGGAANETLREEARLLTKRTPEDYRSVFYYCWAAQVLLHETGEERDKWNVRVRNGLVARQEEDGGWSVKDDPLGNAGGRLMVTSLTLLTLETYYRDDLALAAAARSAKDVELPKAWADLLSDDSFTMRRGLWLLAAGPKDSVAFLADAVRPPETVEEKRVARLIADLDDENFEVRQQAQAALAKLGRAAEPGLRKALQQAPSIELRRRLQDLLAPMERERRRTLQAIEILELISTPQAKALLERLSRDAADPELARTARSALERMTR
jgi:RNA polymerase sigma factor (sigma-70 family)